MQESSKEIQNEKMEEIIVGTVVRRIFFSPDSNYIVLKIETSGYAEPGSTVHYSGNFNGIIQADANGHWSYSQYLGHYGRGYFIVSFSGHGTDGVDRSISVGANGYDPIAELGDGGYIVTWSADDSADNRDSDGFGIFAMQHDFRGDVKVYNGESVVYNNCLR